MKIAARAIAGSLILVGAVAISAQNPAPAPIAKIAALDEIKNQADLDKAAGQLKHDQAQAERHWQAMENLFGSALGS